MIALDSKAVFHGIYTYVTLRYFTLGNYTTSPFRTKLS